MNFPHLRQTSIWSALSPLGRTTETPQGIFYWSNRARQEAEIDGTIGIAQDDDGTISHLKIAEPWAGEKVLQRVAKGKVFGYAPIPGMESLRKKWLEKILSIHPKLQNFAMLPVVTNGITHSLAIAGRLLLEAGQTLITAEKSWENYEHIFCDMQGIKIMPFPLFAGEGSLHIDAIIGACRETAAMQNKVILLLNFPHNQTGFMPSAQDLEELAKRLHGLCAEMPKIPFVIILDDAYEGYVYDDAGQKFSPTAQLFAPLPNLTILKLDGISKAMLAYGYRVGFITAFLNSIDEQTVNAAVSAEWTSKIGGFIRGEISQVNHHGQILADALLDEWESVTRERGEIIQRLRERWQAFTAALQAGYSKYGREKVWADPCNGGFFAYLNLAKNIDPKVVAERLLKEKRIGVVPGPASLRVAFCGIPKAKIPQFIERIFGAVH